MDVLKNKTQGNFTLVSNTILRDKRLSLRDRGLLCTIISLPDGWQFSIAGLSAIMKDGKDAIRASIVTLQSLGYLHVNRSRDARGQFVSTYEVFPESEAAVESPTTSSKKESRCGNPDTDNPTRPSKYGAPETVSPPENNKDIKTDTNKDTTTTVDADVSILLAPYGLTASDMTRIIDAADGNLDKIRVAVSVMQQSHTQINNTVAWLIRAIQQRYTPVSYTPPIKHSSYSGINRQDYDFAELERLCT